ncbi:MAG: helix-turn-helix transcriptional regulator [Paraglaciecola sp.]|nr:helix-turn-helix transcriptional regulator [Paraglaciecola sp.]
MQTDLDSTLPIKLRKRDEEAIMLAHSIIIKNLANVPPIREICLMIGMNRNKFYYGFKYLFKMSLNKYLKQERLGQAYNLLTNTEKSIIDIAAEVGFTHQSSLSTAFKSHYGITPIQLRNKGIFQKVI